MICMGVNSTRMIVCNMWQREAVNRMEEVMKIKKFVKCVLVPFISALFLTALFRPLCVKGHVASDLFATICRKGGIL